MTLAELRAALEAARAELRALHETIGDGEPTDEQSGMWEELEGRANGLAAQVADAERADLEDLSRREGDVERAERRERVRLARERFGGINVGPRRGSDELRTANPMTVPVDAVRSELFREIEGRMGDFGADTQADFERRVRGMVRGHIGSPHEYQARLWQQKLLVRSGEHYERAWAKYVSGDALALLPEEARALAVGTGATGGFLVPTFLDPTIIITNDGSSDFVRAACAARGSVKTMLPGSGNVWKGITSAGITGSWDTESSAVSDDSPTLGSPSVTIQYPRAFAQASYQVIQLGGIERDLYDMFMDCRDRMEATAHCVGTGDSYNQPDGIVTALVATTACQLTATTAAEIGAVDINATFGDVGMRFRRNGEWGMARRFSDAIGALGTAVGYAYTGNIAEGYEGRSLKGRPWNTSDDMPALVRTTAKDPIAVFGDFSGYVMVDRPGTAAVEFVQNMMDPTTGRPTGERGWLLWWEHGADLVVPEALRILLNKTSA